MFLNNTHTLLATLAVSNSSFEQHSHTFGYFCFKKLDRGIKSCPCAAASHLGPNLGTILAPKWSLGAPLGDLEHHLGQKMVPLGLLLAILGTILAQKWSPWGSSSPSWPQNGPLGAPLGDLEHHLGPRRGEPRVGSGPDVAFPVDQVESSRSGAEFREVYFRTTLTHFWALLPENDSTKMCF